MLKINFIVKGTIDTAEQFNIIMEEKTGHNPQFSNDDYVWRYYVEYHPAIDMTYILCNQ